MNKILKSKTFFILVIILIAIGNLVMLLNLQIRNRITISENNDSIVIDLENNRYFEIRPQSDVVIDTEFNAFQTFQEISISDFSFSQFNVPFIKKEYSQKVDFLGEHRSANIVLENEDTLKGTFQIKTDYNLDENSRYLIQIDYSGREEIEIENNNARVKFNDCSVEVKALDNSIITKHNQYNSILIEKGYRNRLHFEIELIMSCENDN